MLIYTHEDDLFDYEDTNYWKPLPRVIPSVTFQTRVYDPSAPLQSTNPYKWEEVTSFDLFARKKVLVFSLPGAFTPTCSTYQLPTFEKMAEDFYVKGFDEIYCVSVNDSFVMNKWAKENNLQNVKVIPDGNGHFTEGMNMLVDKENLGFGRRSWRYACVVDNGTITDWFIEGGKTDNCKEDPYFYTKPEFIYDHV